MRKLCVLVIVLAFAFAPGCASHRHHGYSSRHHDAGEVILAGAAVGALVGLAIWAASEDDHHHRRHRHHHRGWYCD